MPNFLKGDAQKIRQILDNILENAVKYTFSGSIMLEIGYRKISPEKIDVTFSVTDTGAGIRKEEAEKLFYSIGKVGENKNINIKGTGLGLLICKRLVMLLDGEDVGTLFLAHDAEDFDTVEFITSKGYLQ